jgi:hypothetical protein
MAIHKAETNVLTEKLGRAYQGIKQGPSRGMLLVGGLVVLVVVLVFTWRYFSTSSRATASARWLRLDGAVFPPQLEDVVADKDFKGSTPGRIARYKEARVHLHAGLRDLGRKTPFAYGSIRKATELYEELLKESAPLPLLQQEALWGAAKGHESLGDLPKARELYERLMTQHKGSALAADAEKQLARLDNPGNQQELKSIVKEYSQPDTGSGE